MYKYTQLNLYVNGRNNMCVVIAKFLPEHGWVLGKNRDRNYKPEISMKQSHRKGIERLYMQDDKTRYTEGVNEYGVAILSASVMVKKDEKEGVSAGSDDQSQRIFYSPDGIRIRTALLKRSAKTALEELIKLEIPGNTFVADDKECYLLEGAFKNQDGTSTPRNYVYKTKKLKKTEAIARTNHGVFIPWSGYQNNKDNPHEKASRLSSEMRLKIIEKELNGIKEPADIFEALSQRPESDPQMNPIRIDEKRKAMRTTGQLMLIPGERSITYRPIWSDIKMDNFNKVNNVKSKTFYEIISSRKLFDIK